MKRVEKQGWRNQLILDNALDYAILTADMKGRIVTWSFGAQKLFGWTPEEAIGQPLDILFTNEDRETGLPKLRREMASLHRIDAVERYHIRKDGTTFWASGDLQAFYGDDGKQKGFLKIVRDRTEERRSSESLRLSEERVRLAQQAAGIGAFEIDQDRRVIEATPQFLRLLGFPEAPELSLDQFFSVLIDDQGTIVHKILETKHGTNSITHLEFQIRRANDNQLRWMGYWSEIAPRDSGSTVRERILGVLQDVTEHHKAQEKQEILSGELVHRVKNILAIVQSIANQTLSKASSLETASQDLSIRLKALARAQDILTKGVSNSASLKQILESTISIHSCNKDRFIIEGADIPLSPQAALSMALALHELSTNAIKYGALSNKRGKVKIFWSIDNECFRFYWNESGGPKVSKPKQKGFGSKLIERLLPVSFNGRANLNYHAKGVSFELLAPDTLNNFPYNQS